MGYSQRATSSMAVTLSARGCPRPDGMSVESNRRTQDGTAPLPTGASLKRMQTRSIEEVLVARRDIKDETARAEGWSPASDSSSLLFPDDSDGHSLAHGTHGGSTEVLHRHGASARSYGQTVSGPGASSGLGYGSGMASARESFQSDGSFNFDARSIPSVPTSADRRRTYGGYGWAGHGPGPSSASTAGGRVGDSPLLASVVGCAASGIKRGVEAAIHTPTHKEEEKASRTHVGAPNPLV